MSLWVFVAFCWFCDICRFCRAGMSCRVNFYSLSGGGSIGTLPGVVPAAWGGPWRAWRAVRVVPKTRNYTYTRVKRLRTHRPCSMRLLVREVADLLTFGCAFNAHLVNGHQHLAQLRSIASEEAALEAQMSHGTMTLHSKNARKRLTQQSRAIHATLPQANPRPTLLARTSSLGEALPGCS